MQDSTTPHHTTPHHTTGGGRRGTVQNSRFEGLPTIGGEGGGDDRTCIIYSPFMAMSNIFNIFPSTPDIARYSYASNKHGRDCLRNKEPTPFPDREGSDFLRF